MRTAYTGDERSTACRPERRGIMARLTQRDKFQRKIGIEMDRLKARLIELRAKAKEVKLDARVELDKTLDSLERTQGELKSKVEDWTKAGEDAAKDLKKSIKHSVKDLKKSVKHAYKSLI